MSPDRIDPEALNPLHRNTEASGISMDRQLGSQETLSNKKIVTEAEERRRAALVEEARSNLFKTDFIDVKAEFTIKEREKWNNINYEAELDEVKVYAGLLEKFAGDDNEGTNNAMREFRGAERAWELFGKPRSDYIRDRAREFKLEALTCFEAGCKKAFDFVATCDRSETAEAKELEIKFYTMERMLTRRLIYYQQGYWR